MKRVAAMQATGREKFFEEREPRPVGVGEVKTERRLRDRQLMLGEQCHGRTGA